MNFETPRRSELFDRVANFPYQKAAEYRLKGWYHSALKRPGFMLVVVLPTFLAAVYYGLIAADIYVSSPQFVVKDTSQSASLTGLGAFLQSTGLATSANDAYAVDAYLTSRDALRELEKHPGIAAMYDRPEGDFIARFPNLIFGPSFENLFWHYSNWVEIDFDTTSNVTSVTVYGFRRDDVQAIAKQLLSLGETMVNRMNDRARYDALRGARREVAQLQQRSASIQAKITQFRNSNLIIDPNQSSTEATSLLATLEGDMAAARAALSQLQQSAPGSPQILGLRARVNALQNQITEEERKSAGSGNTLAPKMAEYGELLLQQQFMQQMLQSAVTSLEASEATVQQQQLYLERISEPNAPDRAQYPYRLLDIFITAVTALLVYGIGRMLVTAIREHVS